MRRLPCTRLENERPIDRSVGSTPTPSSIILEDPSRIGAGCLPAKQVASQKGVCEFDSRIFLHINNRSLHRKRRKTGPRSPNDDQDRLGRCLPPTSRSGSRRPDQQTG